MFDHYQILVISYAISLAVLACSPLLAATPKKVVTILAVALSAYVVNILPNSYDITWYRSFDFQRASDLIKIIEQEDYEFFLFSLIYICGSLSGAFFVAYTLPLLTTSNTKVMDAICLLMLAPGFFMLQFNTMRQGVSSLYGLIAVMYYLRAQLTPYKTHGCRALILSALWLCLASFTHRSALLLLIFPGLAYLGKSSRYVFLNLVLKKQLLKLSIVIILLASFLLLLHPSLPSDIFENFQAKFSASAYSYSVNIDKSPWQLLTKLVWPSVLLLETYRSLSWNPPSQLQDFTLYLFVPIIVLSVLAQNILLGTGDRIAFWLTPSSIACYQHFHSKKTLLLTWLTFMISAMLSFIVFIALPSISELTKY